MLSIRAQVKSRWAWTGVAAHRIGALTANTISSNLTFIHICIHIIWIIFLSTKTWRLIKYLHRSRWVLHYNPVCIHIYSHQEYRYISQIHKYQDVKYTHLFYSCVQPFDRVGRKNLKINFLQSHISGFMLR